jgi:hypothetical protein
MIRQKLKAAAYRIGGVSWPDLFAYYAAHHGAIGFAQFLEMFRSDAKISKGHMSDADVRKVYDCVDTDGSGTIEYTEFVAWMQSKRTNQRALAASSDAAAQIDAQAEAKRKRREALELKRRKERLARKREQRLARQEEEEMRRAHPFEGMRQAIRRSYRQSTYWGAIAKAFDARAKRGYDGVPLHKFRSLLRRDLLVSRDDVSDKDIHRLFLQHLLDERDEDNGDDLLDSRGFCAWLMSDV